MYVLNIDLVLTSEKRKEILRILRLDAGLTCARKGCKKYTYYQSLEDENLIRIEEIWESRESFESYLLSKEFSNILEASEQATIKPVIIILDVKRALGIEFIERIRSKV